MQNLLYNMSGYKFIGKIHCFIFSDRDWRKKNVNHHVMSYILALVSLFNISQDSNAQKTNIPKNIFILIADGWGINQILATNYWNGADSTSYQQFPAHFFMSTYQGIQDLPSETPGLESFRTGYNSGLAWSDTSFVKKDHTDSAPAATSLSSGQKSADETIGKDIFGHDVELITEYAAQFGKSAGIVTSVPWSHATPAAFSAHNLSRGNYQEIALDMLLDSKLSVIAGCGHPYYDDNSNLITSEFFYDYVGGKETWDSLVYGMTNTFGVPSPTGRIEPMDIDHDGISDPWTVIQDSADFVNAMISEFPPKRLLGTAKCATTLNQARILNGDLPYEDSRNDSVPFLYQMALAGINVLKENPSGFLLMVEGGAIDWANHANQKQRLIEEQQDFNAMVDSIIAWIMLNGGWEENLMIVTGDHECGYLTGPNFDTDNITEGYYVASSGQGSIPEMRFNSTDHTNSLIPFYANGAGSEMFQHHADKIDYMFGYYLDNTAIGLVCRDLLRVQSLPQPKSIIFMVGQGMGFNHLLASNQYMGLESDVFQHQIPGAEYYAAAVSSYPGKISHPDIPVSVDDFNVGYRSDRAWSDSVYLYAAPTDPAAALTSMLSGVKTTTGAVGLDFVGHEMKNIADRAFAIGKSLGMVSSIQFSQSATASLVAHSKFGSNIEEIANEMIIDSKLTLLFGCGAPDFNGDGQSIVPSNYSNVGGFTTWDELNLETSVFTAATIHNNHTVQDISGDGVPDPWVMIRDSIEFINLAKGKTPLRVIGIPNISGTLQQERMRNGSPDAYEIPFVQNIPTLSDMTEAALNILDKNRNGFFLMVDGGAIDRASRMHQMDRLVEEQIDFNQSVNKVIDWVNVNSTWDSTLLIIAGGYESAYLTGPDYSNANLIDGYPVVDQGPGVMPGGIFLSDGLTNQLVPLYAHGAGADIIAEYATSHDYIHGKILNNTQPAQAILKMWQYMTTDIPDIDHSDLLTDVENANTNETVNNDNVKIFPTPVRDQLHVSLNLMVDANVQIFNISGELIFHTTIFGSSTVDLAGLPSGLYMIRITTPTIIYVDKIIKL